MAVLVLLEDMFLEGREFSDTMHDDPWLFLTKPSFVLALYKGKSLTVRQVLILS